MAILRLEGMRETLAVLVPYHRVLARSARPSGAATSVICAVHVYARIASIVVGRAARAPTFVKTATIIIMKPYHVDACTAGAAHANFLNTNFPKLCVQKPRPAGGRPGARSDNLEF